MRPSKVQGPAPGRVSAEVLSKKGVPIGLRAEDLGSFEKGVPYRV